MNEMPRNRAERRASRINPRELMKAIASKDHPLEQRKVWAALLSQHYRMTDQEAETLQGMVENQPERLRDLLRAFHA